MKIFKFGPFQKEWLQSLEQHPERQMAHRLGIMKPDGTYEACCLGEAGLITGTCFWSKEGELVVKDEYIPFRLKGGMAKHLLDGEAFKAMGLLSANGKSAIQNKMSLSELNDNGKTWPELAAIIRKNPENWFNKSV